MSFPSAPMRSLLDEAHKAALPNAESKVWALNLDQIESHSGKVLSKLMLNRNEVGPSTYVFNKGTVLYSKLRPYLNKVVIAEDDGVATTELIPLRCDESKVLPNYLAHFLRSATFLAFATNVVAGAKMPRMVMNEFWSYPVPLPPLQEQRRIAAILDQAETLRTQRRTALALLDSLTQSLFLDMFGDSKTNKQGLQVAPLGSVVKLKSGNFLSASQMAANGQFPVYGGNGVNGSHDAFMFEEPKIVIGRVGAYCGCVHVTEPRSWVTDNALYLETFSTELQQEYLAFALGEAKLNQYASQSGQPLISGARIAAVNLLIPPLPLQQAFATRIQSIEALKATHRHALAALDELFASLQQRAFAGLL